MNEKQELALEVYRRLLAEHRGDAEAALRDLAERFVQAMTDVSAGLIRAAVDKRE